MTAQIRMNDGSVETVDVFQIFTVKGVEMFTAYRPDGFTVYHQHTGARIVNVGSQYQDTKKRAWLKLDHYGLEMLNERTSQIMVEYGMLNTIDMDLEAKLEANKFD
jgi:hypothetical protein